ncbi:MAG TPA: GyrI-like domain-containing protein [Phycisphaerae bacterium]|nr:GyrI-like domain-containing protein [Phycisphaerae bacterium]
MSYAIRIERFAGRPLAVVRRQATMQQLATVIPQACGTVWNALRARGVQGAGRHVAVYLDDIMNLEVGVELDAPIAAFGEVVPSMLRAGEVATTTHLGPYQRLGEAHEAIQQWCESRQREPVRPCWEVYGHWVEEWNQDPSKIRTDVYYLLKTGGSAT